MELSLLRLPVLSASGADSAEPVEAEAPAADDGPKEVLTVEAEEDTLTGLALRKYVKQRPPTQLRPLPHAATLLPRPRRRGWSDLIWTSCCCSYSKVMWS